MTAAEKRREYNRKYYQKHKEKIQAKVREYNAANRDKINARQRAYRADKRHTDGEATRKRRNRDVVTKYKQLTGCERCGYNEHPIALDLHHRYGPKRFQLSKPGARSRRSLLIELRKCVVLCANCHRLEHANGRVV